MELSLNKGSGVPLYKQVRNAITEKIRSGEIQSGFKMPTERELSEELRISRNTVSAAYKELEKEGYLLSQQGKGTFVADNWQERSGQSWQDRLFLHLDMALEEALSRGMEAKAFLRLVEDQVASKMDNLRSATAVYVECNEEQAIAFARQIHEGTGMECYPLTLDDLEVMNDGTRLLLYRAKVIISTFNHVPEVIEYVKSFGKEVLGVAINPELRTIVQIARYPQDTRFTFVCLSTEFRDKVTLALGEAGLDNLDMIYTNSKNETELKEIMKDRDVAVVSPARYKDMASLVPKERLLELAYHLDDGSLRSLKQRLLELNIV